MTRATPPGAPARTTEPAPPGPPLVDLALAGLPRDDHGPVFREPWQAQAFAMAVRLHQAGHFTWTEWAAALADQIRHAQAAGDPDLGDTYYLHWLAALERLVTAKGLVTSDELSTRKRAWEDAALATRHGDPIELPPAERAR
jgi:nitrile hydratase accessory protein